MTDAPDIFAQLAAPFPPDEVEWRVGSTNRRAVENAKKAGENKKPRGLPLCYIDARMVMERLDEVCGPSGWQCDYIPISNGTTCCRIGIKVGDEWVWKANGAGATGDTSKDSEREMAEKGAYSDAFKRAAVLFGVGRYLYTIKAPWIDLDQYWSIPDSEYPKLQALLQRNGAAPKSARQAHQDGDYTRIEGLLRNCKNMKALGTLWRNEQPVITKWPDHWITAITEEKDACKAALEQKQQEAA